MTEPAFLAPIRDSYDTVAADYASMVKPPSELDALTRAMLAAFAEIVMASGNRLVADLGCGPGKVTRHLAELGLDAFGVDLSPAMVKLARQANEQLRFEVGTMTALDLGDGELGGILAFFSTHHAPPEHLPTVFGEFCRTLAPGAHLLLWSHTGDGEHRKPTQAYGGHPVSYESFLLPADTLAELLEKAGLAVTARLTQPADESTPRSHACLLAHKL